MYFSFAIADYSENSDIMETLDAMTDIGVSQNHQNAIVEVQHPKFFFFSL